jgi:hypothetical protein
MKPGANADPTTMPGYSAFQSGVLNPSLEATKRVAAKSGMSYSGNEAQALTRTGEQGYYGFMTDYMNRLATGSGAVNNPAQGGAAGTAQSNLSDTATMQGLGGLLQGAKSLQGISGLFGGGQSNYNNYSNDWVQNASYQMPSNNPANIDPALEWSM